MAASKTVRVYEWNFPASFSKLEIEFFCIRKGEEWLRKFGRTLDFHYRNAMSILWPNDDHHRWSDLILKTYCGNEVTVLVGCSDSSKTYTISKIVLVDYFCYPDETLWLVSTTEGRGSELRIWGCIKDLFNRAKIDRHEVAGKPIDYLKTITTDSIDEEGQLARSLRRGIIVIPCKVGGIQSGLAPFVGIKAPRLRHAGDEVQLMSEAFLNAYSNWYGKEDFKGIMSGNFMETDDPLGIASEPVDGWDSFLDTGHTQEWRSKFYGAAVVALDGRDSPNFDDEDPSGKPRYPYLIGHKKLDGVASTNGKDSWQWYSQCVGKPVSGMDIWRVLSRNFCKQHGALDDVIWKGTEITPIYAIDPAYGGGDLCIGRKMEFGEDTQGIVRLRISEPEIIPVSPKSKLEPEEQIAAYVKVRLDQLDIPAKNCFYDSFGRGTLGFSFAQLFGADCPVPVDAGGSPSSRPVRFDMFIEDKPGVKRLIRCDEYYSKFITELWFSAREAIETGQLRNLDEETMAEGCSRKFTKTRGNLIEIETKAEMKERVGKSPNKFDALAIGVEGSRQLGFKILRAGHHLIPKQDDDWLDRHAKDYTKFHRDRRLANA